VILPPLVFPVSIIVREGYSSVVRREKINKYAKDHRFVASSGKLKYHSQQYQNKLHQSLQDLVRTNYPDYLEYNQNQSSMGP